MLVFLVLLGGVVVVCGAGVQLDFVLAVEAFEEIVVDRGSALGFTVGLEVLRARSGHAAAVGLAHQGFAEAGGVAFLEVIVLVGHVHVIFEQLGLALVVAGSRLSLAAHCGRGVLQVDRNAFLDLLGEHPVAEAFAAFEQVGPAVFLVVLMHVGHVEHVFVKHAPALLVGLFEEVVDGRVAFAAVDGHFGVDVLVSGVWVFDGLLDFLKLRFVYRPFASSQHDLVAVGLVVEVLVLVFEVAGPRRNLDLLLVGLGKLLGLLEQRGAAAHVALVLIHLLLVLGFVLARPRILVARVPEARNVGAEPYLDVVVLEHSLLFGWNGGTLLNRVGVAQHPPLQNSPLQ
mmetsp:Transcript_32496/g.70777  ORF Transcript_32496/g.70777 Transcript_32496/m.70777 type:complete len:343 (-) Transcript_32496:47-1075(-)